ncbi:MAG: YbjN domain-containing protein [Acidobacteriota bacterium]
MAEGSASDAFDRVKVYLLDIGVSITEENEAEELFVVEDEANGIKNLVVDCEAPIVVLEQLIMEAPENGDFYRRLLQINRTLVHGAFVLDGEGQRVFFRDTLQLENLDPNELEGSVRALSLAMAENADELLQFARG